MSAKPCRRCKKAMPAGWPKTSCAPCLERVAEATRKQYHRKRGKVPPPRRFAYRPCKPRGAKAETPKERYARMRAAGLCVKCSTPSGGKQYCDRCALARKFMTIRRLEARDTTRRAA